MSLLKAPYLSSPLSTSIVELFGGATWLLGPEAGFYLVALSHSHCIQLRDPISGLWRAVGTPSGGAGGAGGDAIPMNIYSDGVNYRIANQTGCPVGALLTTAGSGYTSAPTVTDSASAATWRAIVGGAVNTTVTITNGGAAYSYPPIVVFSPPPTGGLPATGYATLTSGAVSSITVQNQGAGYVSPPTITFLNDPREIISPTLSNGYGAAATAALTGAGTVTAVVVVDHGQTVLTSLPTLTFTGGGGSSAAATVIMNWTITAFAAGTAGVGLTGTAAMITALDAFPTTTAAYANNKYQSGLVGTRTAQIKAPVTGGGITATGAVIYDGGVYTSVPTPLVIPSASIVTTAPVVTFTMGGAGGSSYVWQIG